LNVNELLVKGLIETLPDIIKGVKTLFIKNNPGAHEPTDAEVMAAFSQAFISSLAKDDAYLAIHGK